jgi:tetratricopeptide (TPR) repeat protein
LAGLLIAGAACERATLSAGNRLYNAGEFEKAIAEYETILTSKPEHWQANYMVAAAHMELYHAGSNQAKDIEHGAAAQAALERCLKLKAPDEETRKKVENFYVALLTAMERTDAAIAYYEEQLARQPNSVELLGRIGELHHRKDDFPRALEYFQRRAQADSGNKQSWYSVGVLCWERSHRAGPMISPAQRLELVKTGSEALTRAVEIEPKYREALVYLNLLAREEATALSEIGQTREAGLAMMRAMDYEQRALAVPPSAPGGEPPAS